LENIYENLEGGFYFVEGEIFQIIREMTEMTGKNCQITKHGGWKKRGSWNILMKSVNVEGFFFVEDFSKSVSVGSMFIREMRVVPV
jgi:hypothetical protein